MNKELNNVIEEVGTDFKNKMIKMLSKFRYRYRNIKIEKVGVASIKLTMDFNIDYKKYLEIRDTLKEFNSDKEWVSTIKKYFSYCCDAWSNEKEIRIILKVSPISNGADKYVSEIFDYIFDNMIYSPTPIYESLD